VLLQPAHALGVEVVGGLVEQEDVGFFQQQAGHRHAAALAAGDVVHDGVGRRATQGVHRHVDMRGDVPGAGGIDLLLQVALLLHDAVLGGLVGGLGDLVPGGVVGGDEVGEVLHALLDAGAHGLAGRELRLLLQQADGVAGLEMHLAVDLGVAAGEDAHERRFAGAVEAEHADLRPVVKREGDVAEDFLALDFLRDAEHRENDLGLFGFGHGREKGKRLPASVARRRAASMREGGGGAFCVRD